MFEENLLFHPTRFNFVGAVSLKNSTKLLCGLYKMILLFPMAGILECPPAVI